MNKPLKILIAGPKGAGKTILADFLVGDTPQQLNRTAGGTLPNPTTGVCIRECERDLLGMETSLELWDCSGDQNYEQCWPAILTYAHGVILVYNPEKPSHEQEISLWYDYFVKNSGLDDDQCLLYVHRSIPNSRAIAAPSKLSHVEVVNSNYDAGDLVRSKFESFVASLVNRKVAAGGGQPKH